MTTSHTVPPIAREETMGTRERERIIQDAMDAADLLEGDGDEALAAQVRALCGLAARLEAEEFIEGVIIEEWNEAGESRMEIAYNLLDPILPDDEDRRVLVRRQEVEDG